jgi:hypothetical protein
MKFRIGEFFFLEFVDMFQVWLKSDNIRGALHKDVLTVSRVRIPLSFTKINY